MESMEFTTLDFSRKDFWKELKESLKEQFKKINSNQKINSINLKRWLENFAFVYFWPSYINPKICIGMHRYMFAKYIRVRLRKIKIKRILTEESALFISMRQCKFLRAQQKQQFDCNNLIHSIIQVEYFFKASITRMAFHSFT